MRVWDVHPGYLSRSSLLGQHAEIHALMSILSDNKKGYRAHPETLRWQGYLEKLKWKHEQTVKEMVLRGFGHNSPCAEKLACCGIAEGLGYVDPPAQQFHLLRQKYRERSVSGRIPLPGRGTDFWAHHKYSVMARGYHFYREVQSFLASKENLPIQLEKELVRRVQEIMEKPATQKALYNVVQHLWGYFKKEASPSEKEHYLFRFEEGEEAPVFLLPFLYRMAAKYKKDYLLCSTVFADFVEDDLER